MKNEDDLENNFQENMDFLGDFYHEEVLSKDPATLKEASLVGLSRAQDEKYHVLGRLDSGGMKIICQVVDRDTTRHLAMALPREEARTGDDLEKFIREARITALLEHPNIVPIHDIGINGAELPYFTMKLIEGDNLGDLLAHYDSLDLVEEETLDRFMEVYLKICDAIAFAHSKGVLHLDLKPANIHLSDYGDVQVIDWGLARFFNAEGIVEEFVDTNSRLIQRMSESFNHTVNGLIQGTPSYMAPEQALGHNELRNVQTDVYALGAILYSLLTYKKPISEEDYKTVLEKTINGEIVKPSRRTPMNDIPHALESICLKAMKLKAADRYATVDDLITEIRAWRAGYAPKAQNADLWLHTKLFIKRNKLIVSLVMTSLVIITGTLVFSYFSLRESEGLARHNELQALEALESLQLSERKNEATLLELMVSENKTQIALGDLDKAEQEKAALSQMAKTQVKTKIKQALGEMSFDKLGSLLRKLKELDGYDRDYQVIEARLVFASLNFNEALKRFTVLHDNPMIKLINKIGLEKFNRNKLDFEQIKNLMVEMKTIQAKEWLLPLMYRQLNKLELSLAQRLELINLYQIKGEKKKKSFALQQGKDDLWELTVYGNGMINFSAFALLPIQKITWKKNKKKIAVNGSQLEWALKVMSGFVALEELDISGQALKSSYALKNLRLKRLNLAGTGTSSLNHLQKSKMAQSLESINLTNCLAAKIEVLANFKILQEIQASQGASFLANKNLMKKFKKNEITITLK